MAKDIMKSSYGHMQENKTFVSKPPRVTDNATTVEDAQKAGRIKPPLKNEE
jgi:hypothetical protein